jgi:protein involved in polysaccharide export with SLBB domain
MPTSSAAVLLAFVLQAVPFDPTVFKGPHVTLDGLVRRPGGYVLQSGDTISAVVGRAGGVTTDSDPVFVLARTRGSQQAHCIAAADERLETRDNVIVAVKNSKLPMPTERCETAFTRLNR